MKYSIKLGEIAIDTVSIKNIEINLEISADEMRVQLEAAKAIPSIIKDCIGAVTSNKEAIAEFVVHMDDATSKASRARRLAEEEEDKLRTAEKAPDADASPSEVNAFP